MNYTTSKIFVITPIWRRDYDKIVPLGTLDEVVNAIKEHTGVYFAAIGGAAALMARCVVSAEVPASFHKEAIKFRTLSV